MAREKLGAHGASRRERLGHGREARDVGEHAHDRSLVRVGDLQPRVVLPLELPPHNRRQVGREPHVELLAQAGAGALVELRRSHCVSLSALHFAVGAMSMELLGAMRLFLPSNIEQTTLRGSPGTVATPEVF